MNRAWRRALRVEPPLPRAPELLTDREQAAIVHSPPTSPGGELLAEQIKAGVPMVRSEVFSLYPECAPGDWSGDQQAAERMAARLLVAAESKGFDPTSTLGGDLARRAEAAAALQQRWEATIAAALRRHWDRRRTAVLSKASSVQFRRGTPLWDPPGTTALSSRLHVLIDPEVWDRELTQDMEPIIRDMHAEAISVLGAAMVESKADSFAAFLTTWLSYVLGFNRSAEQAVQEVLNAEPTTYVELEDMIEGRTETFMDMLIRRLGAALSTGAINESQNDAALAAGAVEKMWFSAQDGRVRPQHRHVNGQRVPIDARFRVRDRKGRVHRMAFPGDISAPPELWINCRCLPGEIPVSANVTAAMVRPYRGEIIEMVTSGGHKLSATPDHPVLTERGWVLAGLLDPSDKVFCRIEGDGAGAGPDVSDPPPSIQEVFDTLALASARGEGAHVTGVHFDGDSLDSEVDVVTTEDALSFGPDAKLIEQLGQLGVPLPHPEVGLPGDESSLDWIAHPDVRRLTASPDGQVEVFQAEDDRTSLDAEVLGDGEDGSTGEVLLSHTVEQGLSTSLTGNNKPITPPSDDAEVLQVGVDGGDVPAAETSDAREALSAQVQALPLVHLGRRDWVGHVYDLSTVERAFLAGGILTHNCVMLFITPLSENLWLRPDGSPIDPYNRATFRRVSEEKALPASLLDPTWQD